MISVIGLRDQLQRVAKKDNVAPRKMKTHNSQIQVGLRFPRRNLRHYLHFQVVAHTRYNNLEPRAVSLADICIPGSHAHIQDP